MNKLQSIVNIVGEQQKLLLAPSTYDVRRSYLVNLVSHAEELGISEPCQELYDSYVARATTPDLRFQLYHAIRLVELEQKHLRRKGNSITNRRSLLPVRW